MAKKSEVSKNETPAKLRRGAVVQAEPEDLVPGVVPVPDLAITPARPLSLEGNFQEVEKRLTRWREQVAAVELTEANMLMVKAVKKAAQTYRVRLDKVVKGTKQVLFKEPQSLLDARVQPLFALIAGIEAKADEVLDQQERERIAEIQEVLDTYSEDFQAVYQLEDRFAAQVEMRKSYYLKSAKEQEVKADLEAQYRDLKKAQDAYHAAARLVESACKDPRLNKAMYLNMLDTEDTALVLNRIAEETERLAGVDRAMPVLDAVKATTGTTSTVDADVVSEKEKVVLGVMSGIDFHTDFPGRKKWIVVRHEYPCDIGDAMTELFKRLKALGVTTKVVEKQEVVF